MKQKRYLAREFARADFVRKSLPSGHVDSEGCNDALAALACGRSN